MCDSPQSIDVRQFLSETSAHGLSRLGGSRPLHVRVFWALSFLSLSVVFSVSFVSSVQRFLTKDSKTTFYTEKADFTFPDLYVCGLSPFSGSFSVSLTEEEANSFKLEMNSILSALSASLKAHKDPSELLKQVVNSLKFQTVVDRLGHRVGQMILMNMFMGEGTENENGTTRVVTDVTSFHHPEHVTCTRISLSDSERDLLRQPENCLLLTMIVDRFIHEYPIDAKQSFFTIGGLKVYPPEWSFKNGWNVYGQSGLRVFFVEPGTFPAPWSSNALLRPGTSSEIRVSMLQTEVSESDFPNQCTPTTDETQVEYHNPYRPDQPYKLKYSYAYCYYSELTQRMQQLLNCTPWRHPKPASHSDVQDCYNATGVGSAEFLKRLQEVKDSRARQSAILRDVIEECGTRHPCSAKSYGLQVSQIDWPIEGTIASLMTVSCNKYASEDALLLQQACELFASINKSVATPLMWQNLTRLTNSQILAVKIFGEGQRSTMMNVTLDYSLMNLVAETGGFLGLYLGCSVLTLAELLELLHNVMSALLCKRQHRVAGADSDRNEGGEMAVTQKNSEGSMKDEFMA